MISRRNLLGMLGVVAAAPVSAAFAQPPAAFRVALVGDLLFTEGLDRSDPSLPSLLPILRDADLTVGNFEGTLADRNRWGMAISPDGRCVQGMNLRADDGVIDDLKWLGVDMLGTSNNHAWDFGPDGVLDTRRKLEQAGLHPAGTGRDLDEARRASFAVVNGMRVALVSCSSTYWPGTLASRSNEDFPGRPGLNPLRFRTVGEGPNATTEVHPTDLREIMAVISAARAAADLVIVSCHTHEGGADRFDPPPFIRQFTHACVDAGAGIFLGHGPHVLRGVEIYRGAPIFHSLSALIYRARERRALPEELYEVCEIGERTPEAYTRNIFPRWYDDTPFWQGAIAEVDLRDGRAASARLTPTIMRIDDDRLWGMPAPVDRARANAILGEVEALSRPFGTRLEIRDGTGRIAI